MIFFSLPNFFTSFGINNLLLETNRLSPEVFKEKIAFENCSGNFPYCSWNGGMNNCMGEGAYYEAFLSCYKGNASPLRLNFANVCLENTDFYDSMANAILDTNDNGSNIIEISNLELMDYIHTQYPNYNFVFSKQADLITEFTPELINTIIGMDKFILIGIPDKYYKDFDWLQQIDKKSKIELTVNPMCPINCKNYANCHIQEHEFQLAYSEKSNLRNCSKIYNENNPRTILTLEDIKKDYVPLGITHFTFSPYIQEDYSLIQFYLKYFIKENEQEKVFDKWMLRLKTIAQGSQR